MIELRKIFENDSPSLGTCVSNCGAPDIKGEVSHWLCDLEVDPVLRTDNTNLDGFRGSMAIVARISSEAAKQLGLTKKGWYWTNLSLNYF